MGGRALKNTETRRYSRDEFDLISTQVTNTLNKIFKRVDIPLFYKNKKSFGDLDILVSTEGLPSDFKIREYIESTFKPNEIFHNGNCWSFDYNEFQIDLITTSEVHFDSYLMYLSYNDLGNFIGRIAHGFGLKYGQEGLWLEHYFKGKNIGSVHISKNYPEIFKFLGLSYETWERGFNELEDIFNFIISSPFFNWRMFQLDELNKINRDRNKKRASYMTFLDWMKENVSDIAHEYYFAKDKTLYYFNISEAFPEADLITEVRHLEYMECKKLYIQSKFNGGEVMRRFGLKGKELGDALTGFKKFIEFNTLDLYDEYIIKNNKTEIYNLFEEFYKNSNYEKNNN